MNKDRTRELLGFLCTLSESSGKTPRDVLLQAVELIDLERKLTRMNENECNRMLSPREVKAGERLDKRAKEIAAELGAEIELNGDPRGPAIRLKFPSGESNSWGGGVTVP